MKKTSIILITIFIASLLILLKTNTNKSGNNHILKTMFSQAEYQFIQENNIKYEDIKPYLDYHNFNIYEFYNYEKIRINNNFNYTETINYYNYPTFFTPDSFNQKALFIDSSLTLVNKNFYLNANYKPENLTKITNEVLFIARESEEMFLDKVAYDNYKLMFNEAEKNGFELYIFSSYRDYYKQYTLYYYINNLDNHYIAKPGYSEHQTGLALDISTLEYGLTEQFSLCDEYLWLIKNSFKYGFILRFPADKPHITGYNFEPWHFRYVGKEYAEIIMHNNLCLEEYLFKYLEIK